MKCRTHFGAVDYYTADWWSPINSFLLKLNVDYFRVRLRRRRRGASATSWEEVPLWLPHNISTACAANYLVLVTCKLLLASRTWTLDDKIIGNCSNEKRTSKWEYPRSKYQKAKHPSRERKPDEEYCRKTSSQRSVPKVIKLLPVPRPIITEIEGKSPQPLRDLEIPINLPGTVGGGLGDGGKPARDGESAVDVLGRLLRLVN